jgi:hypothetical protein
VKHSVRECRLTVECGVPRIQRSTGPQIASARVHSTKNGTTIRSEFGRWTLWPSWRMANDQLTCIGADTRPFAADAAGRPTRRRGARPSRCRGGSTQRGQIDGESDDEDRTGQDRSLLESAYGTRNGSGLLSRRRSTRRRRLSGSYSYGRFCRLPRLPVAAGLVVRAEARLRISKPTSFLPPSASHSRRPASAVKAGNATTTYPCSAPRDHEGQEKRVIVSPSQTKRERVG